MNDFSARYKQGFIIDTHEILWNGYLAAKPRINSECEETDITGFICSEIDIWLESSETAQRYNRTNFSVYENKLVNDTPSRIGKSRQLIDIFIKGNNSPYLSLAFEAKRLKKNSYSIGNYTGSAGMGCFLNEEYSKSDSHAGMIGYIQSDESLYWIKELKRKFNEQSNNLCSCHTKSEDALKSVSIHINIKEEWISSHIRPTCGVLDLYHIFLDCK
jgi:hypothetical protein